MFGPTFGEVEKYRVFGAYAACSPTILEFQFQADDLYSLAPEEWNGRRELGLLSKFQKVSSCVQRLL